MSCAPEVTIDAAKSGDLQDILDLYKHLNPDDPILTIDNELRRLWESLLRDENSNYLAARCDGHTVSTCVLTVVPNLTRGARPYGLIENVVTNPDYRKRGIGTRVLQFALDIAWQKNCYKVMLLTSSKDPSTLRFYEQAGFLLGEKTGFIARRPG